MVTSTAAANGYSTYFPTPFHLQQQPYIGPAPSPFAPPVYSAPAAISGVYSFPQYQQMTQITVEGTSIISKSCQTIMPEAIENVKAAIASCEIDQKAEAKRKAVRRKAAGQTWEDPTLADWPERKYVGNRPIQLRKKCVSKESKVDNKEHIAQVSVKFFEYIAMFQMYSCGGFEVIECHFSLYMGKPLGIVE
ncbi:hypothetical protein FXO37_28578 [Capsicum annuum]|nr:hypothetical protein FXO37_28578 [Capsicum annuum]